MIGLSEEEIKGKILHNIARKRQQYINRRDAVKGFPSHMIKEALSALDNIVKEGLLLPFKKGECVGVNISQKSEVERLIRIFIETRFAKRYERNSADKS